MRGWKVEHIAWWVFTVITIAVGVTALLERGAIARYLTESGRDATLARAGRLEAEGDTEGAARLYTELAENYPDREEVLLQYGMYLARQRKNSEAEEQLRQAASLGRTGSLGILTYGDYLLNQQRIEEAEALFLKHVEQWSDDTKAWSQLAEVALEQEDFETALKGFNQVIELEGASFKALRGKGDALRGLSKTTDALEAWKRSLQVLPLNPDELGKLRLPYYEMATAYEELENWEAALDSWKAFVEYQPNSWLGYTGITRSWRGPMWDNPEYAEATAGLGALMMDEYVEALLSPEVFLVGYNTPEIQNSRLYSILHFAYTKTLKKDIATEFWLESSAENGRKVLMTGSLVIPSGNLGASVFLPVWLVPRDTPPPGQYNVVITYDETRLNLWTEVYP